MEESNYNVIPMGEKKNTYRALVRQPEGKRAVGRPRRRWKNSTIMWYLWGRRRIHTGLWCGNLREREQLEDPGVDGRIQL